MYKVVRTNSEDKDFLQLVQLLDKDLAIRDGKDHSFFSQYNKVSNIKHVVLLYDKDEAIACGAFKAYYTYAAEIKRMFTSQEYRGKGLASMVLKELEKWAVELSFSTSMLETGIKQPEAIRLYKKNGYHLIPNYEPYVDVSTSRCFEKELTR